MSNRFEKLYSLSGQLYAPSSPVIITAGTLLKDTQTGKVLAQLKFKNINSKVIKAVTVSLLPLDTANQPLGEKETHQILDLTANRDDEFGQKTPLYFSNNTTRAYQVVVEEVVFSDNTVWKTDGAPLSDLPAQKTAADMFSDDELEKQYKLEYGERATYIADTCSDLWRCSCGAINQSDEQNCHGCGATKADILSFDIEQLKSSCHNRLEEEHKKAEQHLAESSRRKKQAKKIGIISFACLCAIAAVYFIATSIVIPNYKLKQSVKSLENGDYTMADKLLNEIGKKDSLNSKIYKYAVTFFENGEYEQSIVLFEKVNDYLDSPTYITNAKSEIIYTEAVGLIQSGEYSEAISLLKEIKSYKDSSDLLTDCVVQLTEHFYQAGHYLECIKLCEREGIYPDNYPLACYYYANELQNKKNYSDAISYYKKTNGYADSNDREDACENAINYSLALSCMEAGNLSRAITLFKDLGNYEDSSKYLSLCTSCVKYDGNWICIKYYFYDPSKGTSEDLSHKARENDLRITVVPQKNGEIVYKVDGLPATRSGNTLTYHRYNGKDTSTFNLATGACRMLYRFGSVQLRYDYTYEKAD